MCQAWGGIWLLYRWSFLALSIALKDLMTRYQLGDLLLLPRPEDSIYSLEVALLNTKMSFMNPVECFGSELRRDDASVHFQQNLIFNCDLHTADPARLNFFADLAFAVWPTLHHIFYDSHKDWVFGHVSSDFILIINWNRCNTGHFIDYDDVHVFLSPP